MLSKYKPKLTVLNKRTNIKDKLNQQNVLVLNLFFVFMVIKIVCTLGNIVVYNSFKDFLIKTKHGISSQRFLKLCIKRIYVEKFKQVDDETIQGI